MENTILASLLFPILSYLILCIIIGIMGSYRTTGFLASFLLSLFLTPLLAIIIIALTSKLISDKTTQEKIIDNQIETNELLNKLLYAILKNNVISTENQNESDINLLNQMSAMSPLFQNPKRFDDWNEIELENGDILKYEESLTEGTNIVINNKPAKDGLYKVKLQTTKLKVENSILIGEFYPSSYVLSNGAVITIECNRKKGMAKGCFVYINNELAPDGHYKLNALKSISVKNGVIA